MAIKKIPCGGFYVDDGAVQNVDGKPVLSAWNADLPKPSVGGYGYTEQGEQTVITWDGNTSGKVVVVVDEDTQLVKIADVPAIFDPNSVISISDTTGEQAFEVYDVTDEYGTISYRAASNAALSVVVDFVKASQTGVAFTENGIYVQKGGDLGSEYITSLTYSTPDTIHKIDEKYLPEAGGNDFIIELPSRTGALAESTIAQLDSVADFIAGNLDKKQPYTIKCYVPHPDIGTIILDCTVSQFKYNDQNSSRLCRITGSNLSNMSYTQDGLEFFCVDFYKNWNSPWTFNFKTAALTIGDMF